MSLFLAKFLLSNTTLPSLLFSSLCFPFTLASRVTANIVFLVNKVKVLYYRLIWFYRSTIQTFDHGNRTLVTVCTFNLIFPIYIYIYIYICVCVFLLILFLLLFSASFLIYSIWSALIIYRIVSLLFMFLYLFVCVSLVCFNFKSCNCTINSCLATLTLSGYFR